MCGYDRVIVEPSGIYDVDEFFDALREDPLDQWYEIGNVITIVDAKLEKDLSETADTSWQVKRQMQAVSCFPMQMRRIRYRWMRPLHI